MGKDDAIDWEQEATVNKIVDNFKQGIKEGELAKKLARYYEIGTELMALEATKDALRTELLEIGKGEESIMAGDYAAFFKKVSGRASCDWKQAYRDAVGEMKPEDVSKYVKKGEDSIRVEIKKLK